MLLASERLPWGTRATDDNGDVHAGLDATQQNKVRFYRGYLKTMFSGPGTPKRWDEEDQVYDQPSPLDDGKWSVLQIVHDDYMHNSGPPLHKADIFFFLRLAHVLRVVGSGYSSF